MKDIISILEDKLGKGYSRKNGEYLFYCPLHGDSEHKRPKLAINIEEGKYQCWMCGFSGKRKNNEESENKIWSRMFYKMGFYNEAVLFYKEDNSDNRPIGSIESINEIIKKLKGEFEETISNKEINIEVDFKNIFASKHNHRFYHAIKYLTGRKIKEDDFIKFDIRYSPERNRLCFPSYNNKMISNYYVERTLEINPLYPYKNPDIKKDRVIFNEFLINFNKPIIIVEGIFDAITAGKNSIPLLGSSVSRNNSSALIENLIINNSEVILALDPDAIKKQFRIAKTLSEFGIKTKMIEWGEEEKRDINEMGKETFNQYLKNNVVEYNLLTDISFKLKNM